MRSFYKASAKVPESPYPPELIRRSAPSGNVAAGRPTSLMLSALQLERSRASLPRSEGQHASLQQHLRTSCRRHVALAGPHAEACAERFPHEDEYGKVTNFPFPDWPIGYETDEPIVRQSGSRARRFRRRGRSRVLPASTFLQRLRLSDAEDSAFAVRPTRRRRACAVDRRRDQVSLERRRP